MEENCIEMINEKCSLRRPLESKALLQQYGYVGGHVTHATDKKNTYTFFHRET
jgi:hypothetical protein